MLSGETLSQFRQIEVRKSQIQPGLWLVMGYTYKGGLHRLAEYRSERWATEARLTMMKRRMEFINRKYEEKQRCHRSPDESSQ